MSKKHVKTPSPKKQVEDPFSPDVTRARPSRELPHSPRPSGASRGLLLQTEDLQHAQELLLLLLLQA